MTLARLPSNSISGLRLGTFIAVSLAVHWLILAGVPQTPTNYPAATALSVRVVSPPQRQADKVTDKTNAPDSTAQPAEPSPIKSAADPQPSTRPTRQPKPAKDVATIAESNKPAARVNNSAETTPPRKAIHKHTSTESEAGPIRVPATALEAAEKPTFTLAQAKDQIREQLNSELGRFFRYPYIAQRRGWEGMVLVDLMIDSNGDIGRISVAQSSGYSLLDNSAIETLNRIGNIKQAARWLQGRSLELTLPVIYRLTNS
jgi:protein TonB